MKQFTQKAWEIFNQSITDYHKKDHVDTPIQNPYSGIDAVLYHKNWIDSVQWHLEDIVRDPAIDPREALVIKRRIDASNQDRTNRVEDLDEWFYNQYSGIAPLAQASINTESPAWAIDRLSILALKIFHMDVEASRTDAEVKHLIKCQDKLNVLWTQHKELTTAINQLLQEYQLGSKYMRVYKQMKMYNDASLNPVLYKGITP